MCSVLYIKIPILYNNLIKKMAIIFEYRTCSIRQKILEKKNRNDQ